MACLSPSPSGRRLSELLEERQEPFFLDLHLLEKGCSGRLLDGYDTALCWPAAAAGNDAASVLKRLTSKKKKKAAGTRGTKRQQQQPAAGSGLLQLLLSKILHGKAANQKPAALQCSESFKLKRVAPSPLPCSKHLDAVKLRADAGVVGGQEMEYSDSEYDDEKQQSPVSVLEHPFERSPAHGQSRFSNVQDSPKNAMAIVRELLMEMETACTPALRTQLFAKSEDLVNDANDLADHDGGDDYYYRASPKNFHEDEETAAAGSAACWATHRAELARVSELVSSEVPVSRLDAANVQPERRDVSGDVETALLDALLLELVMDLGGC